MVCMPSVWMSILRCSPTLGMTRHYRSPWCITVAAPNSGTSHLMYNWGALLDITSGLQVVSGTVIHHGYSEGSDTTPTTVDVDLSSLPVVYHSITLPTAGV